MVDNVSESGVTDAILSELDAFRDEYESLFTQGKSPQIADFLLKVGDEDRGRLFFELVALDVSLRHHDSEATSIDEWVKQYDSLLPPGEDPEALRSTIEKALGSTVDGNETQDLVAATGSWAGVVARGRSDLPKIDGFEIQSVLGRGGMGVVYKAVQTALNRTVALKMILDQADSSGEYIDRFEREAKAVAELNDPSFVQIYEFGVHAGCPYMTLEFVEGGSLEEFRHGEPQPERLTAEIVEALARAMQTAHQVGLVHRDLKPHNVLMTSAGKPKITDFGLVKRHGPDQSQMTEHGRVMGTASYMAPEQSRGEQNVGPAADVHALGGILYCLLTGRPPFLGVDRDDTISQVRHDEPVAPSSLRPGLSKDLETICLKCLQKETGRRYALSLDLADDLQRFLDGRPIIARPVGFVERSWRWSKRNPLGATVAGLVVAIAVISSVMSWRLIVANEQLAAKTQEATQQTELAKQRALAKTEGYNELLSGTSFYLRNVNQLLRNTRQEVAVRKRLQELAIRVNERLRDNEEETTLYDRNEAIGAQTLGDIYTEVGEPTEAIVEYDRAYVSLARAQQAEPDVPLHDRNLGVISAKQAGALERLGETKQALEKFRESLKWKESWDAGLRSLGEPPVVESLAEAHFEVGRAQLLLGDAQSALASLNQAHTLCALLLKDDAVESLCSIERRLGEAYYQLGDRERAEQYLKQALDRRKAHFGERQTKTRSQALARAHVELGDFYLSTENDLAKVWEQYEPAYSRYMKLYLEDKASAATKHGVANIEYRVGVMLLRAEDQDVVFEDVPEGNDPNTHFVRCFKLRENLAAIDPDDMQSKIELALALARCGQFADAAAQAKILFEKGEDDPRLLFQAACTFALCTTVEDPDQKENYQIRTFEVLEQLIASGWKDLIVLRDDPDLAPVRNNPRFDALISGLAATENPSEP